MLLEGSFLLACSLAQKEQKQKRFFTSTLMYLASSIRGRDDTDNVNVIVVVQEVSEEESKRKGERESNPIKIIYV